MSGVSVLSPNASGSGDVQYHRQVLKEGLRVADEAAQVGDRQTGRAATDLITRELVPAKIPRSIGEQILDDVRRADDPVAIRADHMYVAALTAPGSVVQRAQRTVQDTVGTERHVPHSQANNTLTA